MAKGRVRLQSLAPPGQEEGKRHGAATPFSKAPPNFVSRTQCHCSLALQPMRARQNAGACLEPSGPSVADPMAEGLCGDVQAEA
eukprot:12219550-Alexandrium_andersonii.AAC.1